MITERNLREVGPEYVSDLNHTNTLLEPNRKLPYFMRGKWVECAGRIIEAGQRPKCNDFLKFVNDRAKLLNDEFGEDLVLSSSREVCVEDDLIYNQGWTWPKWKPEWNEKDIQCQPEVSSLFRTAWATEM